MPTGNSWLLNHSSFNVNKDSLANNFLQGISLVNISKVVFAVAVVTVLSKNDVNLPNSCLRRLFYYEIYVGAVYIEVFDQDNSYKY